jgi:hypothetical protein
MPYKKRVVLQIFLELITLCFPSVNSKVQLGSSLGSPGSAATGVVSVELLIEVSFLINDKIRMLWHCLTIDHSIYSMCLIFRQFFCEP